jgi:polyisoprenoid-binding protein YceI
MKKISVLIMMLTVAGNAAALTPSKHSAPAACVGKAPSLREYRVDFGHSIVEFSIKFAFTRVKGRFTAGEGTILYDSAAPSNSSITMILESKSLDTGWPHRDEHLRTSDFFDTEKYPTIEFRSRRLSQTGQGWTAEGDLTMHGVTRRITIPFRLLQPPTRDSQARWLVMNIAGTVQLARADFGITGGSTYNSWFNKARAATMGDSVDVNLEVEAYLPDAASQQSPGILAWVDSIKTKGVQSQLARFQQLMKTKTPAEINSYLNATGLIIRGLVGACRLSDAVAFSKGVTELYPNSHPVRLVDGFVLTLAGDKRGAAADFAKAKEVFRAPVRDPTEKFPQVDDTWWYLDQLVQTAIEWGYANKAVPLARAVAELYPETARAHVTYGESLAFSGDTKTAAAAYARAVQVNSRETRALEWQRRL